MNQTYIDWLYGLSAPMVALNKEYGASYSSPFFFPDRDFVDMSDDWGIDSRQSLLELVFRMVDNGHAPALSSPYFLYSRLSENEWQDYASHQTDYQQVLLEFVAQTASECGVGGIRSWDYARMGYLLRNGTTNKYITEQECLWILSRIALRVQYYYSSWERYCAGWFIGRHYWKALDIEDLTLFRCALSRVTVSYVMTNLHDNSDSPLNCIPWFVELEETEKPESLQEYDWS